MTDEEMSKLADIIVDKIIERQKAYDEEFKADIQSMVNESTNIEFGIITQDTNIEFGIITQDELIIEEIDGLKERLAQLEEKEDYESAKIVANKIKHLKNKYKL
jgi:protein-arginine kinase activator protein McsA